MEEELLLTLTGETYQRDIYNAHNTEAEAFEAGKKAQLDHNEVQLAKATEHYKSKLQQMALNYDIICKETDAISYTRGVLEGRKQERERIINWLRAHDRHPGTGFSMSAADWQALKGEK